MAVTTVVFAIMSHFYTYADTTSVSSLETFYSDGQALINPMDAKEEHLERDENKK